MDEYHDYDSVMRVRERARERKHMRLFEKHKKEEKKKRLADGGETRTD